MVNVSEKKRAPLWDELFKKGQVERLRLPVWLQDRQRQALDQFAGMPVKGEEQWRSLSLQHLDDATLSWPNSERIAGADDLAQFSLNHAGNTCVFFENGFLREDLSHHWELPEGVIITPLSKALQEYPTFLQQYLQSQASSENPLMHLNEAFFQDGIFIHVPRGVTVHAPIEVVFYHSQPKTILCPRVVVIAEDDSRVALVEVTAGQTDGFVNSFTTIQLKTGAHVEHYRLQEESLESVVVSNLEVYQQKGSDYSLNKITLGGSLSRLTASVFLDGEGATCTLSGLYLAEGTQVQDHHVRVDHLKPRCTSRQYFRGALQDASKGVFNDLVVVHQGASKSSAHQNIKNLLLSEKAEGMPEPMLKILNDDVQCSHGATVGQLDEAQIFYLKSRGIDEEDARKILTFAFLNDIIDRIPLAAFKSLAITRMVKKFKGSEEAARHFYPCPL